ncbi:MAG TPA: hypothetical protein VFK70_15960, partial [Vicinamibacteria bacterium]|nr:hypothetical protein [Vicinamibacteria bacterium]
MMTALLLALANSQAPSPASAAGPPAILQVYREPLKPGAEAEYDRLESENARECARLRCPHPYLGLESLTGPKEVWWLNGYESDTDRKRVAEAWAASTEARAALGRNGQRKAALVGKGVESMGRYRPDLSGGEPWQFGTGAFLVIGSRAAKPGLKGTVYETDDHALLVIATARTREEAEALASGAKARVFAVHPSWSHADEVWIASDPDLWRGADCLTFSSAGTDAIAVDGSFEGRYVVAFGGKGDGPAVTLTVTAARESPDGGSDIHRTYTRADLPVELPRGTVRGFEFVVAGRRASSAFWVTLARNPDECVAKAV